VSSVLVTGASSGIGRATAERLERAGWTVWAGVRDLADGSAVADGHSARLRPLELDVADEDSIATAFAEIERQGGIDAVVNNAGIGVAGPLELLTSEELREQLEVNVVGQLAVTRAALPLLRRADDPRIVFVGSIGGRIAFPFAGAYHASKYAIEALGDSLRVELEPEGIPVSIVEPPAISTAIWDKARDKLAQLRERPGAERYSERLNAFSKRLQSADESGGEPDEVATTIEKALTEDSPSARYPVGASARLVGALKPLIPDPLLDKLTARVAR
jgi:NAD(P)-dependent dehydrogenase (short-subunit alcohol dehydrogenase family)